MGQVPEVGGPPRGDTRCFANKDRVCGGDCEAFDPTGVNQESESACKIVNSLHRGSMSLITIARIMQAAQPMSGANVKPPGV